MVETKEYNGKKRNPSRKGSFVSKDRPRSTLQINDPKHESGEVNISSANNELISRYNEQNNNTNKTVNSSHMQHYEIIKERDSVNYEAQDLYASKETTFIQDGGVNH